MPKCGVLGLYFVDLFFASGQNIPNFGHPKHVTLSENWGILLLITVRYVWQAQ